MFIRDVPTLGGPARHKKLPPGTNSEIANSAQHLKKKKN